MRRDTSARSRPVKAAKDHGPGRLCVDCERPLNRYNKGPRCYLCEATEQTKGGESSIGKTRRSGGRCA